MLSMQSTFQPAVSVFIALSPAVAHKAWKGLIIGAHKHASFANTHSALACCREKPVIKKALVELDGRPFAAFAAQRLRWAVEDCFRWDSAAKMLLVTLLVGHCCSVR